MEEAVPKPEPAHPGGPSANEQLLDLVQRHLDRAYRLAGMMLGNVEDARDATQDAALRAWRAAPTMRDPARFGAWFDRILVNACRDQLRRRARIRFIALEDSAPDARDPFRAVIEGDEVLRAIADLDDDLRLVLILHYWSDLALDEVAVRTGWPVGTVKSRLNRALETLRGSLGAALPARAEP